MARIRSKGTSPEIRLESLLRSLLGWRRRIDRHLTTLPGQPDFFVQSLKLAVFLDGCFYHCCPRHGHIPKSNRKYWQPKLARNTKRDKKTRALLRRRGISVWRLWEHQLKPSVIDRTTAILERRIRRRVSCY